MIRCCLLGWVTPFWLGRLRWSVPGWLTFWLEMLRCCAACVQVPRRFSALVFARADHMTPPVKENIDAVAPLKWSEFLGICQLHRGACWAENLQVCRWRDWRSNLPFWRLKLCRHWTDIIFPTLCASMSTTGVFCPVSKRRCIFPKFWKRWRTNIWDSRLSLWKARCRISDTTIDPINRYREDYFKWFIVFVEISMGECGLGWASAGVI